MGEQTDARDTPTDSLIAPDLQPRRRPVQQRSRERFARILESARELLLNTGFETLTCEAIAANAGLPVGTLYQFFPNKFSIVCELDRLDTESVAAEVDRFAEQIPTPDWAELLDAVIDHLADAWLADPSRRFVWLSMQATNATRDAAAIHQQQLFERVGRVLAPLTPKMPRPERTMIAQVVVHTVYSMLNFSVREPETRQASVRETKRLVLAYLAEASKQPFEVSPASGRASSTSKRRGAQ